jgi:flagellar capping protein FliD
VTGSSYTPGTYAFDIDDSANATLGGTAMTVSGSSYTMSSGNAAGVTVSIIGSGADTNIYLGRSLLESLRNYSTNLLQSSGDLSLKIKDFNDDVLEYDTQLTELDTRMASVRDRYNTQFLAMQRAVASLNDTKSSLDNMMEAWKGSMK